MQENAKIPTETIQNTEKNDPENKEFEEKKLGRPEKEDQGPLDHIGTLSIFDETQPRTLINIVPEELRIALRRLQQKKSRLFFQDERVFKKMVDPDAVTCRLRLSFWDEYTRAQDLGKRMVISNIVRGACSLDYFYKQVMTDMNKMAWICCPPKDYVLAMRELLDLGIDEWRDILAMPHRSKSGKPDVALIAQKIKIVQMLDLRVKGAIVQKLQVRQHNSSVNVNVTTNTETPMIPDNISLEELELIEKRLEAVKEVTGPLMLGTGTAESDPNKILDTSGRRQSMREDKADTYEAELAPAKSIESDNE